MTDGRSTAAIAWRSLLFTVVIPGTVAVYAPWLLLQSSGATLAGASAWRSLGLVPLAVGVAVYVRCVTDFAVVGRGTPAPIDPPEQLVVRGLYRFARNPMYLGVLATIGGEACLFASLPLAVYGLVITLGFHGFVVLYEEPTLRRSFGAAYEGYCAAVPRWIPRRPRGTPAS